MIEDAVEKVHLLVHKALADLGNGDGLDQRRGSDASRSDESRGSGPRSLEGGDQPVPSSVFAAGVGGGRDRDGENSPFV